MSWPSPETIPSAVFDTSPLVFLDTLDYLDVIADLFGVVVTTQVVTELSYKPDAPGSRVLERSWLSVQNPKAETLEQVRRELGAGAGESASIALGIELNAAVVLDDLKARRYARERDLEVVGTLGILVLIHRTGWASRVPQAEFSLLEAHGMWLSERIKGSVLRELGGD